MRREVVFAAEGFSKRFGDNHVLKNAAVHARRGQVTVLLGRNGVGKTTLLRGALGFVPVDNGSVLWRGTATLRPRLASMAREGLFYVPATGLAVPKMRVTKHLQQMRALSSSSVSLKDGDPLEISSFAGARVARLSGGEERRVEVTLGLLRRPRCLIMDEPFKGLAPKHQGLLAQALRRNAETGTAIIVTGHEVERLLSLADEVVWMVAGGTRVLGSPEDALEYPEFARQYLGSRARVSRKAVSRSRPSTEDVSSSEPVRVLGEAPPHSMHRPPWCLRPGLFGRALWTLVAAPAAVIWLAVVVTVGGLGAVVDQLIGTGGPSDFVLQISLPLVAICVFLAWVERRRTGVGTWLRNLGIGLGNALVISALTCLVLEIAKATFLS